MPCGFKGCGKQDAPKLVLIANWGKGRRWIVESCREHYRLAHRTRRLPDNLDIERVQALPSRATLKEIRSCVSKR